MYKLFFFFFLPALLSGTVYLEKPAPFNPQIEVVGCFLEYEDKILLLHRQELLKVSRPFLTRLLEEKKIPFRKVASSRFLLFQDLMDYKIKIDTDRRKTLDELAKEAQELDMGY